MKQASRVERSPAQPRQAEAERAASRIGHDWARDGPGLVACSVAVTTATVTSKGTSADDGRPNRARYRWHQPCCLLTGCSSEEEKKDAMAQTESARMACRRCRPEARKGLPRTDHTWSHFLLSTPPAPGGWCAAAARAEQRPGGGGGEQALALCIGACSSEPGEPGSGAGLVLAGILINCS